MAWSSPTYGFYPPYAPQRVLRTEKGLSYMSSGLIVHMAGALLLLVAAIIIFGTVQSVAEGGGIVEGTSWAFLGSAGVVIGGGLLFLLAFVLWVIGSYEMYSGRTEFGDEHARKVYKSIIFLVIWIVLIGVGQISTFLILGFTSNVEPQLHWNNLMIASLISSGVQIVQAVFLGLALVCLVTELCDEGYKSILSAALFLYVGLTAFGITLSLYALYTIEPTAMGAEGMSQLSDFSFIAWGLSFIPFVLFLVCFRHALKRVRSGEILPVSALYTGGYQARPSGMQPHQTSVYGNICPRCGSISQAGGLYCERCGSKLQ